MAMPNDDRDEGSRVPKAGVFGRVRVAAWILVALATLFLATYWFRHIGPKPKGIVGLELAWNAESARSLLSKWNARDMRAALDTLRWDTAFIPFYVATIWGLCVWGARSLDRYRQAMRRLAIGVVLSAGVLDFLENILLNNLLDHPTGGTAHATTALASIKFASITAGLLFGFGTAAYRVARSIEGYLRKPSPGTRPDDRFRTQMLAGEESHHYEPLKPKAGSVWRAFLGWLIALPAPPTASEEGPPAPEEDEAKLLGICCSGGGIRSAAFNLGALQVMREKSVLNKADYVSAVSGGAYIAASHAIVSAKTDPGLLRDRPAYDPASPEAAYLLNHSSYLGPPGIPGKLWMIVRTLLGVAINVGFLSGALFLVGRPLGWLYRSIHPHLSVEPVHLTMSPWMWMCVAIPAGVGVLLVLGELLTNSVDFVYRLLRAWYIRFINIGLVFLVALFGLPYLIEMIRYLRLHDLPLGHLTLPTAGVSGLLLGAIQSFVSKRRKFLAIFAGAVVGPLMLLSILVIFAREALFAGFGGGEVWLWVGVATVFSLFYLLSDLTSWSPHPFYKRALWSAFGIRRAIPGGGPVAEEIPYDKNVALSELVELGKDPPSKARFPKILICAAANVSDEWATPPGRDAVTFVFEAERVGGPMVGCIEAADLEDVFARQMQNVSVGAAVAVSGAAISPSMGKMTHRSLRFLMGLLNIRLGVWLPNPRWAAWWTALNSRPGRLGAFRRLISSRPRPLYLAKEMLGVNKLSSKFLYVTDGGHYENLGLVELLRRGCREIYCFDASGDHEDTFNTIGEAVALARTELDVEISDFRPEAMIPRPDAPPEQAGFAPVDCARGRITYSNGTKGWLLFAKATVTGDAPSDVRAFKKKDKRFPNHSTVDQFFNEEKFEAYRTLGRTVAEDACSQGFPDN